MNAILNLKAPEIYIAFAMFGLALWLRRYRARVSVEILRQVLRFGSVLVLFEMLWRTGQFANLIHP